MEAPTCVAHRGAHVASGVATWGAPGAGKSDQAAVTHESMDVDKVMRGRLPECRNLLQRLLRLELHLDQLCLQRRELGLLRRELGDEVS